LIAWLVFWLVFAATAAGIFAVKKTIIDPELKKEEFINENRRKAARKRVSH
jgi:hypothetical protein